MFANITWLQIKTFTPLSLGLFVVVKLSFRRVGNIRLSVYRPFTFNQFYEVTADVRVSISVFV